MCTALYGSDRRCRDKAVPYRACASVQLHKGESVRFGSLLRWPLPHCTPKDCLGQNFCTDISKNTQTGKHVKNNTTHKQKG